MIAESSSEHSRSSDEEFWRAIENTSPKRMKSIRKDPAKVSALYTSERERYEKTIHNIRTSKEVEMQNLEIKVRNQTKKDLFATIHQLRVEFAKESHALQATYANSRSIIQQKENMIVHLTAVVAEQESLISSMRILMKRHLIKEKTTERQREDNSIKNQVDAYKEQIKVLKQVCEEFKDEFDKYKKKNDGLIEENSKLKNLYESVSAELANFANSKCEKLKNDKECIEGEFNRYRLEVTKELDVRELLNKRQSSEIYSLKEELKKAKMILNIPRVKFKALQKLKDIEVHEKSAQSIPASASKRFNQIKIPSKYSYKEYKAFNPEDSRAALRALSNTPITNVHQKSNNNSFSNDSRQKFSKNSILYYNALDD